MSKPEPWLTGTTSDARIVACVNFCTGYTVLEGPDAPTLADVLGALDWATTILEVEAANNWEPDDPAGPDLRRARAILSAFTKAEPEESPTPDTVEGG